MELVAIFSSSARGDGRKKIQKKTVHQDGDEQTYNQLADLFFFRRGQPLGQR